MSSVVPPTAPPATPAASRLSGDGFVEPSLLVPPLALDLSARALESLSARVSSAPIDAVLLYDFDRVGACALTHLAEQLHILGAEGWEFAISDEHRRTLLKDAIALHRHKGTKWSIVRALAIHGLAADIEEWFEYGGEPYYFRVIIDGTDLGAPDLGVAIRTALEWKNARSHLEMVRVRLNARASVHIRAAAQFAHTLSIRPREDTNVPPRPVFVGGCLGSLAQIVVSVYPRDTMGEANWTAACYSSAASSVRAIEQVTTGVLQ